MIARMRLQDLEEALEPARDQLNWKTPAVQIIETGRYKIAGTGRWYDVTCGRKHDGKFFVACTCLANLHGKHCYHALKAFEIHIGIKMTEKENNG